MDLAREFIQALAHGQVSVFALNGLLPMQNNTETLGAYYSRIASRVIAALPPDPEEKRCKTCRWRGTPAETTHKCKTCTYPKLKSSIANDGHNAPYTHADFGCVHHDPIPAEHPAPTIGQTIAERLRKLAAELEGQKP